MTVGTNDIAREIRLATNCRTGSKEYFNDILSDFEEKIAS